MRASVAGAFALAVSLSCAVSHESSAEDLPEASAAEETETVREAGLGSATEPATLLPRIEERASQKDSLFPVSPLRWLHNLTDAGKQPIEDAIGLKIGAAIVHLFQGATDSISGTDQWGTATTADFIGSLDLIFKGKPTAGQVVAHGQIRWDYGTTGPEDLGFINLASLIGTADTFSEYDPPAVLRNLYWRQGSREAGWVYRIGKITPDALLNSSSHLASDSTFLPGGATGPFAIALPDSGLGAVGAWYFHDRAYAAALFSDANADRFNFGDIGEGDFFKAVEFGLQLAPRTEDAPFSKLTFWHNDGTHDGQPINGMAGPDGWGFFVTHQQELTADGRAIGILRYGKSFDNSGIYEQIAGVHFLLYEAGLLPWLEHDVIGAAFNWAQEPRSERNEYNIEIFYRFPIFPSVDMSLSYQHVINPVFTRDVDDAAVFSLRIRTTF